MARQYNVNEQIRAREVRVVEEEGGQLGIMTLPQALQLARERNLDLVEVAPEAAPPVCRVMDYDRFRYQQARKERESKKTRKTALLRELRLRPNIDEHDLAFKTRTIRKLLLEGDKVKISVLFRGREMAHPEVGAALMKRVIESLKDDAKVERNPIMEGRILSVIISPTPTKGKADKATQEAVVAQAKNA